MGFMIDFVIGILLCSVASSASAPAISTSSCASSCIVCSLHPASAPMFVHPQRPDGVGATLQQMIYAAAFAHSRGWNYGGALGPLDRSPHGFSTRLAAQWLFGSADVLVPKAPSRPGHHSIIKVNDIRLATSSLPPNLGALEQVGVVELKSYTSIPLDELLLSHAANDCPSSCNCSYGHFIDDKNQLSFRNASPWLSCGIVLDLVFQPVFLAALRAGAHCRLGQYMNGQSFFTDETAGQRRSAERPTVAVHVRRGDVSARSGGMFTPNDYYITALRLIREQYPRADVHIFSSSRDPSEFDDIKSELSSSSEHKTWSGLHLNGSPLVDWMHFATADIFVMAKSTFSHVPAVLNEGCVVYQHHWRAPLSQWVGLDTLAVDIKGCLTRAWAVAEAREEHEVQGLGSEGTETAARRDDGPVLQGHQWAFSASDELRG